MIGLILAGVSAATSIAGAIAGNNAQNKNAKATRSAADKAANAEYAGLNVRALQERIAAATQVEQGSRQAMSAASLARLSAVSSGVAGQSADAILQTIEGDRGRFNSSIDQNLDFILAQLEREELGVEARRQSRISSAPKANPFLAGLTIAGSLTDFGTQYLSQKPPVSGV